MRPLAELELEESRGVVVARVEGEIDLSNAEAVRVRVEEAVPNTARGLVFDLTALRYLDSSGLRVLFHVARRLERRRQRLATVARPDSPVHSILDLVGAIERLGVHESPAEALAAVAADAPLGDLA